MTRRAFSVSIYARHRGRVLLIKHERLGLWLPPGGEIEPGETPLEAAKRELQEETGLTATFPLVYGHTGAPRGMLRYEEHDAGSKGTHLNFVFVADAATDQVQPNSEFTEYRWVAREQDSLEDEEWWAANTVPDNVAEAIRTVLFPAEVWD